MWLRVFFADNFSGGLLLLASNTMSQLDASHVTSMSPHVCIADALWRKQYPAGITEISNHLPYIQRYKDGYKLGLA